MESINEQQQQQQQNPYPHRRYQNTKTQYILKLKHPDLETTDIMWELGNAWFMKHMSYQSSSQSPFQTDTTCSSCIQCNQCNAREVGECENVPGFSYMFRHHCTKCETSYNESSGDCGLCSEYPEFEGWTGELPNDGVPIITQLGRTLTAIYNVLLIMPENSVERVEWDECSRCSSCFKTESADCAVCAKYTEFPLAYDEQLEKMKQTISDMTKSDTSETEYKQDQTYYQDNYEFEGDELEDYAM